MDEDAYNDRLIWNGHNVSHNFHGEKSREKLKLKPK